MYISDTNIAKALTTSDLADIIRDDAFDTMSKYQQAYAWLTSVYGLMYDSDIDLSDPSNSVIQDNFNEIFNTITTDLEGKATIILNDGDILWFGADDGSISGSEWDKAIGYYLKDGEAQVFHPVITVTDDVLHQHTETLKEYSGTYNWTIAEILSSLSESVNTCKFFSRLATLASSGDNSLTDVSTAVSDCIIAPGSQLSKCISSIKDLGSNISAPVLLRIIQDNYNTITSTNVTSGDTTIDWNSGDFTVNAFCGSVLAKVFQTAFEAVGTILVVAGGVVWKVAGVIISTIGYVWKSVKNVVSYVAEEQPRVNLLSDVREWPMPICQDSYNSQSGPVISKLREIAPEIDDGAVVKVSTYTANFYFWKVGLNNYRCEGYLTTNWKIKTNTFNRGNSLTVTGGSPLHPVSGTYQNFGSFCRIIEYVGRDSSDNAIYRPSLGIIPQYDGVLNFREYNNNQTTQLTRDPAEATGDPLTLLAYSICMYAQDLLTTSSYYSLVHYNSIDRCYEWDSTPSNYTANLFRLNLTSDPTTDVYQICWLKNKDDSNLNFPDYIPGTSTSVLGLSLENVNGNTDTAWRNIFKLVYNNSSTFINMATGNIYPTLIDSSTDWYMLPTYPTYPTKSVTNPWESWSELINIGIESLKKVGAKDLLMTILHFPGTNAMPDEDSLEYRSLLLYPFASASLDSYSVSCPRGFRDEYEIIPPKQEPGIAVKTLLISAAIAAAASIAVAVGTVAVRKAIRKSMGARYGKIESLHNAYVSSHSQEDYNAFAKEVRKYNFLATLSGYSTLSYLNGWESGDGANYAGLTSETLSSLSDSITQSVYDTVALSNEINSSANTTNGKIDSVDNSVGSVATDAQNIVTNVKAIKTLINGI